MVPVLQSAVIVMDDGSYGVLVRRGGASDCAIEGATIIRSGSLLGRLIKALVWLGGPYKTL